MKKSKLIVPAALAVMLLSTAASVTGTVAWFTANKSVQVDTTAFSVKAIDGNLTVTPTANFGTSVGANATTQIPEISIADNSVLTDGSVDHVNSVVYRKKYKGSDTTNFVDSESENYKRSVTVSNVTTDYYFAISWKLQFTYEFSGDAGTAINLYFDPASTATGAKDAAHTSGTIETYKGFRIAFVADTAAAATETDTYIAGNTKVWAPLQVSSKCFYVNSVSQSITENAGASYASGVVLDSAMTGAVAATADTGASTAINCLGQFTGDGSKKVNICFTCYAWFEGTDENVVNNANATFGNVVTSMKFFIRPFYFSLGNII